MNKYKGRLPETESTWLAAASTFDVLDVSASRMLGAQSASKMRPNQYFALRVLWKVILRPAEYPQLDFFMTESDHRIACDLLDVEDENRKRKKEPTAFTKYLKDIEMGDSSPLTKGIDFGSFSLVRYYQLRSKQYQKSIKDALTASKFYFTPPVAARTRGANAGKQKAMDPSTPTPSQMPFIPKMGQKQIEKSMSDDEDSTDEVFDEDSQDELAEQPVLQAITPATGGRYAPAKDEQIVNTALLALLQNLTIYHPKLEFHAAGEPEWTVERLQLKFESWTAVTDGYLRINDQIKALVEVKPYVRKDGLVPVQAQESAQMAAWIYRHPDDEITTLPGNGKIIHRRLMISQDSFEIYLSIAEYDDAYKDFLHDINRQTKNSVRSFMTMTQYGPYDTTDRDHMKCLGPIILAFTCARCNDPPPPEVF